ncbi:hypothetical protein ET495_17025 [Xylanimonas allomyrinae]|uniref:Uncharacterized protein n=1 Tax=Xylanimonas allomyrinae TaxID=2509459 RepID=A0A4P6EP02_9MICO|nr:hypothetical protein [Xylanimonas allomyrinae]QAY64620.1 hypothetical protein ET495_17025 [Xylanimonas allomyrinae]
MRAPGTATSSVAVLVASALLAGAAWLPQAPWFPHASWSWGTQSDVELVATAHTDVGRSALTDARGRTFAVRDGGHARATATASALCDGCAGRAATVEVVYVPRGGATADNVAAAWASGGSGTASAVAVQVVVQRPGTGVTASNRALAVSADCAGCTAEAVAVQVVVLTRLDRTVSARTRALLENLADVLGTPVPDGPHLRRSHHSGPWARGAAFPAPDGARGRSPWAATLLAPAPLARPVVLGERVVLGASVPSGEQERLGDPASSGSPPPTAAPDEPVAPAPAPGEGPDAGDSPEPPPGPGTPGPSPSTSPVVPSPAPSPAVMRPLPAPDDPTPSAAEGALDAVLAQLARDYMTGAVTVDVDEG